MATPDFGLTVSVAGGFGLGLFNAANRGRIPTGDGQESIESKIRNPKSKIYVDVSSAVHAKAGIGRYAASLARALVQLQPERLALFYNRGRDTAPPAGLEAVPARTVRAGYKPWRMAVWLGHLAGLGFDRLVPGAELFHATEHLLPPLHGVPTVLTVHDMIFKLFPQPQKRLNYWYLNATMPLYCRRADAIITVSECSKRDIVDPLWPGPGQGHGDLRGGRPRVQAGLARGGRASAAPLRPARALPGPRGHDRAAQEPDPAG